ALRPARARARPDPRAPGLGRRGGSVQRAQVMSGVTSPLGFRAAATACGIRPSGPDLALIAADRGCSAAAVFTANRAQAAPVVVSRAHVAGGTARAVLVNAGCANAGTGEQGLRDAREMAALAGEQLGCQPTDIVVASTGVIGLELPMER